MRKEDHGVVHHLAIGGRFGQAEQHRNRLALVAEGDESPRELVGGARRVRGVVLVRERLAQLLRRLLPASGARVVEPRLVRDE